jgi:predicted nucleotide-binding protein (sugar kinase/HSP70/actin superfamily)
MLMDHFSLRNLADYINLNGFKVVFLTITTFLLFCYFLKTIFKQSQESMLREIMKLLIEIKAYLMGKDK